MGRNSCSWISHIHFPTPLPFDIVFGQNHPGENLVYRDHAFAAALCAITRQISRFGLRGSNVSLCPSTQRKLPGKPGGPGLEPLPPDLGLAAAARTCRGLRARACTAPILGSPPPAKSQIASGRR